MKLISKRLPFDSELKVHHLSRQDLDFFISTFVQRRFPYNIKTDEYPDWVTRSFYGKHATLDDHAIAKHLVGKHLIAVFPGSSTKYLALDIDHSGYLREILKTILRILPDPLVIQSSTTKGIHVYYFFDSVIRVDKLQKLMGTLLNIHGIPVQPGYCEVFPQMKRALRLPLGKGSYVVDQETLDPIHRNAADGIRLIKEKIVYHSVNETLQYNEVEVKSIPSISLPYKPSLRDTVEPLKEAGNVTALSLSGPPKDLSDRFHGRAFKDLIDRLLREGIQTPGTRYFVQSKLVYYYWSLKYTREECYDKISKWYRSHDHNSKGWKKNSDRVLRQLRSAINSFYRQAELKRYQPGTRNGKLLTTTDVRTIIEMTPDYRNQKFIYSLLEYALNKGDSKSAFELPKISIIKFACCSNTSYQQRMTFCKSIGLITNVREYYSQNNRARTYHINYNFAGDGDPVTCLEEGLKYLFGLSELRRRYSRQYFHHIINKGA